MAAALLRRAALAGALLVGCGSGGDDAGQAAGGASTTATAPGGPVGGSAAVPSTSGGAASTTATPSADPTTTAAPTPEAGAPLPATLEVGGVGDFAPALLRADRSARLVVEVHADVEPRRETLEHVADLLGAASGKPVAVVSAGGTGGGSRDWTASELRAAADAGSTTGQGGGVAVVRLLFLAGTFEGDDDVLGVAVRGDVAAVFLDRVERAGGLLGGSDGIEVAVTAHELGHLLGLVDLHRDTGRDDPEHPGHSRNPESVMYWAVESSVVGQLLGADPPRHFDDDDRADLAAIRAGG